MKVSFLDLKTPHLELKEDLTLALTRVLESGRFILGEEVEAFESEFAAYCNVAHCVGVGNGLDALHLLLCAYGIRPGDEVIVPSNTFIATWLAVTRCGAKPVPVEPTINTFNIDPNAIEQAISNKTRAIIPVHLYGQPAEMNAVNTIAEKNGLVVIEDSAQAQGACYNGQRTGSLGHAAATSFYPGKNLGALGDGGAILTNDGTIADKVRRLRNYGSDVKYQHDEVGFNSRLDELQAAFLRVKLSKLDEWNQRRVDIANRYSIELLNTKLKLPYVPDWASPVWHLYVVRSTYRKELQQHLNNNGIDSLIHYPIPPHKQKCYPQYFLRELPKTEHLAEEILSLPISPHTTNTEIDFIVDTIRNFEPKLAP
jgi:dTDP-4-amino-4,6-dideoxygalactose transaminase